MSICKKIKKLFSRENLDNYPSVKDHPNYAGEETDENKGQ